MKPNTSPSSAVSTSSSTPFPTTRSVPPPIDLAITGSHIMRASNIQAERRNKAEIILGCKPYDYAVLDLRSSTHVEAGTSSTSTFGSESPSSSWTDRADLKLVPNRRRRSYSASGYSLLTPPTSANSVQSTSTTSSGFSDYSWPSHSLRTPSSSSSASSFSTSKTPKSASSSFSFNDNNNNNNNNTTASPNGKSYKKKPSLTSAFGGFGLRRKLSKETVQAVEEEKEDDECSRVFGASNKGGLNVFVHFQSGPGDSQDGVNIKLPRKKVRRPGSSPLTLPTMFVSEEGSSTVHGGSKKKQRPWTANSTPPGSLSPTQSSPPRRSSKLDWQLQWKRWSLLKSSTSNSSSMSTSPSTPLSPSSFQSPTSPAKNIKITTTTATKGNTTLSPPHSAPLVLESSITVSSKASKLLGIIDNERCISRTHRSTPNLQVAPELSMEDIGKINAFYAPAPTVRLQMLTQTTSNPNSKLNMEQGVVPKVMVHAPSQTEHHGLPKRKLNSYDSLNVNMNMNMMKKEKGIPIALPLSPASSGEWRAREDKGAMFLTVELERDGEAVFRCLESPM